MEMVSRLPVEKVSKINGMLQSFSKRKKVILRELQSLLGLLNFATGCVVPGRAFLCRLYDLTINVSNPNIFSKLNNEARADLAAWAFFYCSCLDLMESMYFCRMIGLRLMCFFCTQMLLLPRVLLQY